MPALVPLWAIGFLDQVWWSRFALPRLHAWQSHDHPVRLIEQVWQQGDPDPKALASSRVLWQEGTPDEPDRSQMWVREVSGRPESRITIPFLDWCCERLYQQGKRNWLLSLSITPPGMARKWYAPGSENITRRSSSRAKAFTSCPSFCPPKVPG